MNLQHVQLTLLVSSFLMSRSKAVVLGISYNMTFSTLSFHAALRTIIVLLHCLELALTRPCYQQDIANLMVPLIL